MKKNIYVIFDIGKTNKKCLLFDDNNILIEEQQEVYAEIEDEDGFPCDDLTRLTEGVLSQWQRLKKDERFDIKGVNFTAYGASFVYLDENDRPVAPLYNYLKPMPPALSEQFYRSVEQHSHQSKEAFAAATCSPPMGLLNSGLQLYYLKYAKPATYEKVATALHLPQYLSFLISGKKYTDFTSLGCHTALWDFTKNDYHDWVKSEGIEQKLAPITTQAVAAELSDGTLVGVGLHDSSSALLPYSTEHKELFILISTGTWCINLNSFNQTPLSIEAISKDCLSYMTPKGQMTKASRVFFGKEHDHQVERIAQYFTVKKDFYKTIAFKNAPSISEFTPACMEGTGPFPQKATHIWDLSKYDTALDAYLALMRGLMDILKVAIGLVDNDVPTLFVDGGFVRNAVFMGMLKSDFPDKTIKHLDMSQATALGALCFLKTNSARVHEAQRSDKF